MKYLLFYLYRYKKEGKTQGTNEKNLKKYLTVTAAIKDKDRFPLPDQVEDRFRGNDIRETGMTENIYPSTYIDPKKRSKSSTLMKKN